MKKIFTYGFIGTLIFTGLLFGLLYRFPIDKAIANGL